MIFTVLRRIANAALWALALVGVVCGLVWGATALGIIKPLIVVSGSMEPTFNTGDLLIDRLQSADTLRVGDIASIYTPVVGRIVTHRAIGVSRTAAGEVEVLMKGDANEAADGGPYYPGDKVWVPRWRIAGGGTVVAQLTQRRVVIPAGIALAALLAFSLLPRDEDEDEDPAADPDTDPAGSDSGDADPAGAGADANPADADPAGAGRS